MNTKEGGTHLTAKTIVMLNVTVPFVNELVPDCADGYVTQAHVMCTYDSGPYSKELTDNYADSSEKLCLLV